MGKLVAIRTPEGDAQLDAEAGQMIIARPDGGIILRPAGLGAPVLQDPDEDEDFDENLADYLTPAELGAIATDLLLAIDDDWSSASNRRKDIETAIKVLGINVEEPRSGTADSAVEGQSTVRSPLLLEAVLNFQANASAELLPAAGPVKMRYDGQDGANQDVLTTVENLEKDFNHYLTTTASEYYPDTTRMLFDNVGLAGSGFKKVFHCPIRKRPVSESVAAENLIVNAGATDLKNADRITERWTLSQNRMKQLQIKGFYRDVKLGMPTAPGEGVETAKLSQQGISQTKSLPINYQHRNYSCHCYLDHEVLQPKDAEDGLPVPFRVTIEIDSRQILEIRRDWKKDDENYERRQTYVKWPFVEAMGFYGIGLMHILGNTTNGMTGTWRVLLDAGMFSNFPGWLYAKDRIKGQDRTTFRVGVGQGVGINTGGQPITDVAMPLPYKEPSATLIQLANMVSEAAQRLGNTPDLQVGEGNQQAPVGTTIALLEQAQKMMASVHKGLHAAQAEEFQLLKELFREDPESFWKRNKKPSATWTPEMFEAALANADIVPAADPNTPSHMHRVMRCVAMIQLATAFPQLFGQAGTMEAAKTALRVLGWDPEPYLQPDPPQAAPQPPPPPPDPVGMAAVQAKAKADAEKNQTDLKKTQMQITSTEKIKGAELTQKAQADQQAAGLERAKLLKEHISEMTQLRHDAQMNAMKGLGLGTRVI
jgi:hypothetical protein